MNGGENFMLVFKRILSVILFLPFFILHLLFRYIGILTLLTSGFTTTLLLIIARVLAFLFLITLIVILATEELRIEWASWVGWLLFGLLVLLFHYLAALNEELGGWFLDFSDWLSKVPSKLWAE